MIATVVIILLMLAGYALFYFAWKSERRWLRVLLALVAAFWLANCAALSILAAVGDGAEENLWWLVPVAIHGIAALAALVFAIVTGFSRKQPSTAASQDLTPRQLTGYGRRSPPRASLRE